MSASTIIVAVNARLLRMRARAEPTRGRDRTHVGETAR
jgi:hypothetical protein